MTNDNDEIKELVTEGLNEIEASAGALISALLVVCKKANTSREDIILTFQAIADNFMSKCPEVAMEDRKNLIEIYEKATGLNLHD